MAVERIKYEVGGKSYIGALVWNDKIAAKRPLMLMSPNWLGVTPDAIKPPSEQQRKEAIEGLKEVAR